jgi:gluconate 5-dehydrogenase
MASPQMGTFSLEGRVALVTGAARGLGAAMAEALGEAGAHVILNDIDSANLEKRRASLAGGGLSVEAMAFDVTDEKGVAAAIQATADKHGRLDILVNNAGIAIYGSAETHGLADWNQVMNVDLTALFLMAREAASVMSRGRYGRIINIASVLGLFSRPGIASYVVAKHGVVGLTRALATELGDRGITCNALAPGYFETSMSDVLIADAGFHQMIVDRTPAKRWARPEELRGPVVFLASPASSFVNGHVLVVDGGMTASLFQQAPA